MVPESMSMEMEQKQESDSTKVLVHSSDSVVQQNLAQSIFLHRFQHSSSSVETLEKEKPMHIKVLVHSSDSILRQKSELFHQNFLVSSRFRVLVQKQKPRYLLVLVHSTSIQEDGVDVSGKQVYISAPERTTVNPPEETQVFSFNGAAVATEDRAYKGTGSLFGFTGAAESRGVSQNLQVSSRFRVLEKNPEAEFTLEQEEYLDLLVEQKQLLLRKMYQVLSSNLLVQLQFSSKEHHLLVLVLYSPSLEQQKLQQLHHQLQHYSSSTEVVQNPEPDHIKVQVHSSHSSQQLLQDEYHTVLRKVSSNLLEHSENLLFLLDTLVRLEFSSLEHPQIDGSNSSHQNQHKYTSSKVDKYFYRIPL